MKSVKTNPKGASRERFMIRLKDTGLLRLID